MAISVTKRQAAKAFKNFMNVGGKFGLIKEAALLKPTDVNDSAGNLISTSDTEYYNPEAYVQPVTEKDRTILEGGIAEVGDYILFSKPVFTNENETPTWAIPEEGDRIKTRDMVTHKEITLFVKAIIAQQADVFVQARLIKEQ